MNFAVRLTQPAIRDLQSLPETAQSKIADGLLGLRDDPFPAPPLKKKLKGFGFPLYRLRVADHRLLYRIDGQTVTIMRVVDGKNLEKAIKRLK